MVKEYIPSNYKEALKLLNENDLMIVAGGTDVMVRNRNWSNMLPKFSKDAIYTRNLEELNYIRYENDELRIGANASLENILNYEKTPQLLKDAIYVMASPAIRNAGTIAGNIGNASPAGDTLPILYVLNAKILLENINDIREVSIKEFITGPGKTIKNSNEIIKEIIIENQNFSKIQFIKVGGRKTDAISKLSFTGAINIKDNIVKDLRLAFGAVGPTVIRKENIESKYVGLNVNDLKNNITNLVNDFNEVIKPIDDQRSNKVYRKQACLNLLKTFIDEI